MSKQRIFDSIEHLKYEYNLNVEIPKDTPEGCNVICYNTATGSPYLYKEEDGFLYYLAFDKTWCLSDSETLEGEVEWDKDNLDKPYAYLRLVTEDNSDVFTPERLLGVETKAGFITSVEERFYMGYQARVTTTNGFSYFMETLDYYISDDSDETVSFEDYVNKFYDGGISEAKFTR